MDMRQLDAEIQKRREELSALETARAVLGGSVKPTPRKASGGRTRAPRGQRKAQVLAALTDQPQGPSAIAKQTGMTPQATARNLKQLAEEKQAKKRKDGWVLATTSQAVASAS